MNEMPNNIEATKKPDLVEIIRTTEEGIDELETKLETLAPGDHDTINNIPANINYRLRVLKKEDKSQEYSEQIADLIKRFNDILDPFKVDWEKFQVREK